MDDGRWSGLPNVFRPFPDGPRVPDDGKYEEKKKQKEEEEYISSGEEEEDLDLDVTLNIEDDFQDEERPMLGSPGTDEPESPDEMEKAKWKANEERKRKMEEMKKKEALERYKKRKEDKGRMKEEDKKADEDRCD